MTLYERPGDDLSRGLIRYWKLDDLKAGPEITTAIDQANFNDGTINGATNTTGINGLNPDAMNFNGSSDYTSFENFLEDIQLDESFTVSTWINSSSVHTGNIFNHVRGGSDRAIIVINSNSIRLGYYNGSTYNAKSSASLSSGWNHIVFIHKSDNSNELYINGFLDATGTNSPGSSSGITFRIGSTGSGAGTSFFNGSMSNLRVYNRILTTGEVSKLHRLKL